MDVMAGNNDVWVVKFGWLWGRHSAGAVSRGAAWLLAAGYSFERWKERTVSRSAAARCSPASVGRVAREKLPVGSEAGVASLDTLSHVLYVCFGRCVGRVQRVHAALPGCSAVLLAPVLPWQTRKGSKGRSTLQLQGSIGPISKGGSLGGGRLLIGWSAARASWPL